MSLNRQEVWLNGRPFPTDRPVRRTLATPFAPKMTIGDHTRDSEVLRSSWIIAGMTGGLGKRKGDYPQDAERYEFSTLESRYAHQITLGQQVRKLDDLGPADVMIDYSQRLYYSVGNDIYRWNDAAQVKEAVGPSLTSPAADICVFFGKLYILTGVELVEYDAIGNTWTTYDETPGLALVGWDGKLFRLLSNGELYWTIEPIGPDSWTLGGKVPLPPGYADQLVVYFDLTGETAVHVVTSVGVYAYDFASGHFYQTGVKFPLTRNVGKRSNDWRSELYIPAGSEEYKYNIQTVLPTGPNKDDGLPMQYRGDIARVTPGHAFRYLFVNGAHADEQIDPLVPVETIFTSALTDSFTAIFDRDVVEGVVLASPGTSWHAIHTDPAVGDGFGSAIVATIEGKHRLFFSSGSGLYATDSPTSMHNPLQNPNREYATTGYLVTPWFDSGWAELNKLALSLEVSAEQCSAAQPIRFYLSWDDDESWTLLGTVTRSGATSLRIGGARGRIFRSVRLRIEMETDDEKLTPVLRAAVLTYTRHPKKKWVWDLTLAVVDQYGGRTAHDLQRELEELANSDQAIEFRYRSELDGDVTKIVEITQSQAVEQVGNDKRGKWIFSLAEID